MYTGVFKKDLDSYLKENGGKSGASKKSQVDLYNVGKKSSGVLQSGKMYIFNYYTENEGEYDMNPIVIGLGKSKDGNQLALNLHYIPYNIRVSLVQRLVNSFSGFIQQQIKGTGLGKPNLQNPIIQLNWDNLKLAYNDMIKLEYCTRQYKISRMYNPYVIGYENWFMGVVNDENSFFGTTISLAQAKLL